MKNEKLKKVAVTSVFAAIAFLLTFLFRFKVGFLTFDFKDAVLAMVSLMYGPLYGVTSAALVTFLEFLSVSDTGPYGLIMNFISSGTFTLIFGLIYKYKRTFVGAIASVVFSVVGVTFIMMLANYFITPYYMGVSLADVVALIPTLLLPFNLAKSIINAAATLILYKPVTNALRRVGILSKKVSDNNRISCKSIVLYSVALLAGIVAVILIVFLLQGEFEFMPHLKK